MPCHLIWVDLFFVFVFLFLFFVLFCFVLFKKFKFSDLDWNIDLSNFD